MSSRAPRWTSAPAAVTAAAGCPSGRGRRPHALLRADRGRRRNRCIRLLQSRRHASVRSSWLVGFSAPQSFVAKQSRRRDRAAVRLTSLSEERLHGGGYAPRLRGVPVRVALCELRRDDRDDLGPLRCPRWRSEEHTSELQSRFDLVCRLLLEKKNKT